MILTPDALEHLAETCPDLAFKDLFNVLLALGYRFDVRFTKLGELEPQTPERAKTWEYPATTYGPVTAEDEWRRAYLHSSDTDTR